MAKALAIVHKFVAALNQRDPNALRKVMAKDHRFIGATGTVIEGRRAALENWESHWELIPNYHITVHDEFIEKKVVALFGSISGTVGNNPDDSAASFVVPAAWRVETKKGEVSEWQVYASSDPVREALHRHATGSDEDDDEDNEIDLGDDDDEFEDDDSEEFPPLRERERRDSVFDSEVPPPSGMPPRED